ncbi:succinylglutamate desuccinylase/aspartoacylase family protein [Flagellimonas halotolerans]|uniref:Succinylglutamate desuccinylase/aspartoacylase family protein n=1 Tax=Flagellimonas halotolerans TaxID=3112164 RepID=A0ABU6IMF9_9FLAO|nr:MULTISPECIES: succinylglutamate desuccinylase/aspartoacylase family protein [unclassified Allomuricauda]MEC3964349.1 succinylglutamate desuccinylase/aspartoacylase family protein [Muricauda sp. SYSU M86414]MEC4264219.1 succinylglutamate desuccinylase/aspartoacylase family protein [Muricauda sp. SYSU M84420]
MTLVHNIAWDETIRVDRIIDHIKGIKSGPTVVFFGGIHGNETAGVFALKAVFNEIRTKKIGISGEVYAISGNLGALESKQRFQDEDLNRIWFPERIERIVGNKETHHNEDNELNQLYRLIQDILKNSNPPFYFLDLHTTSSHTPPFMVLNDSLLNRTYASNYPLPIILGIEEYLKGALLSYINELGYVSLGFESGQHNDGVAIQNSIEFIRYSLALTQSVDFSEQQKERLRNKIAAWGTVSHKFYEIYHQYDIGSQTAFKMFPGFVNFQIVPKGESLALVDAVVLKTTKKRQIFMPLYQKQGNEGFYFIRPIPKFWLWLSKKIRRFKVDHILVKLPGVEWETDKKDTLMVDQRVARFFTKSFFHLLGYRARKLDKNHLVAKNRESASKSGEYKGAAWFKK